MKRDFIVLFFTVFALLYSIQIQAENFKFALFTDLHISTYNPNPSEDLTNSVNMVNKHNDLDFVIITGDVTENGDKESMQKTKKILDQLDIPYYITAGNHETKWSESGVTDFARVFGDDKFSFTHKGNLFIGFTSGPVIKMGDGHIAPQDISWTIKQLKEAPRNIPAFICTHYPLQDGDVDNWYVLTDSIRLFNIQTCLGGHYHRNMVFNYDGICGVLHRSNLRDKNGENGFTTISISDSIRFYEETPTKTIHWLSIPYEEKHYDVPNKKLKPSFKVNSEFPKVKEQWKIETEVGIYGTPALYDKKVYFGDDLGNFYCIKANNGKEIWKKNTPNRIISSPAAANGKIVFGSTDGNIYCLNAQSGKEIWKFTTTKAVLGMPIIDNNIVYIGGSDGCFRAIDLNTGIQKWVFSDVHGYIETRPTIYKGKIYFGAWDNYLYALNIFDGSLVWKWSNGKTNTKFSPAAVLPVVAHGKVFITAPDRYWTALNAENGEIVWRTKQHVVRETIGISEDGNSVYSRCMNDSIVAIDATANTPKIIWKTNANYGYDHNPSMLIERDNTIIFGTKNGILHGINAKTGQIIWKHKIGNSLINTITPISGKECIISTSEGVVAKIKVK